MPCSTTDEGSRSCDFEASGLGLPATRAEAACRTLSPQAAALELAAKGHAAELKKRDAAHAALLKRRQAAHAKELRASVDERAGELKALERDRAVAAAAGAMERSMRALDERCEEMGRRVGVVDRALERARKAGVARQLGLFV